MRGFPPHDPGRASTSGARATCQREVAVFLIHIRHSMRHPMAYAVQCAREPLAYVSVLWCCENTKKRIPPFPEVILGIVCLFLIGECGYLCLLIRLLSA